MTTMNRFLRFWNREQQTPHEQAGHAVVPSEMPTANTVQFIAINIAANDALLLYLLNNKGVVDVSRLNLDSPAVRAMKSADLRLCIPLVSQGDLIGVINLGNRRSEQDYTSDDLKFLNDLAAQAAPALRVAQLVHQQKEEAAERERIQQELKVARLIQQTLLPQTLPQIAQWDVSAYYQPARAVGGDFYDFINYPDGRIGFLVADVTDKGVPAALVMATTRSILRAAAERLESPGAVLERTNSVLVDEIPPKMFVTCFLGLLNPLTGQLRFANAGHDVPYRYTTNGVVELRATGMPLGLMPGMSYEEKETVLEPGDYVLLYSDGLVEAHNPQRAMFGFPKLQALLATHGDGATLNQFLLDELAAFTGAGWEQEDDVTLVTIQRHALAAQLVNGEWHMVTSFEVASAPGNERFAMQRVAEAASNSGLDVARLDRLKTAVAEATMNAMEHGNRYDKSLPVVITVETSAESLRVKVTDHGVAEGGEHSAETPDLARKLTGEQTPRGWGLFLIENMVDKMQVHQTRHNHIVELIMNLSSSDKEHANG